MCFSAHMSFIASAVLTGIAAVSYASVTRKEQLLLATIPLLFAIQQAAEGLLWVLLPQGPSPFIAPAMYTFLSIALIVWPLFIPYALLMLEDTFLRRLLIALSLTLGIAWSFVSTWYLLTHGVQVVIDTGHLLYMFPGLMREDLLQIGLYCLTTVAPFFASSYRALNLVGVLVAVSVLISYVMWYQYFVSVWCFFAALISISVVILLRNSLK